MGVEGRNYIMFIPLFATISQFSSAGRCQEKALGAESE